MKLLTELGAVYVPDGNPGYAYLVVRINVDPLNLTDGDLSNATLECLQLWTNAGRGGPQPGSVWSEPLEQFETCMRKGEIVRWRKGLREK